MHAIGGLLMWLDIMFWQKNMAWEWISHYVCDSQHYFLAFFGQHSIARLSKWIIFSEEHYCDAVPTKIEASTLNSHKKMALQSSCSSDQGICGLAYDCHLDAGSQGGDIYHIVSSNCQLGPSRGINYRMMWGMLVFHICRRNSNKIG